MAQEDTFKTTAAGNRAPKRLPRHALSDFLIPLSTAIDLVEGREAGHARRVAYIAMCLAEMKNLGPAKRLDALYASLMHDIGMISVSGQIAGWTRLDERTILARLAIWSPEEVAQETDAPARVAEQLSRHGALGGHLARELSLSDDAAQAIAAHHETYAGTGYPDKLTGESVTELASIVGLADQLEAMVSDTTPLFARRSFSTWTARLSEKDPRLAEVLPALGRSDAFWHGLNNQELAAQLSEACTELHEPRSLDSIRFVEAFTRIVDSRLVSTRGFSTRVAALSDQLGRALGFTEAHRRRLVVAAHLHDVGQLAVPASILAKPALLDVEDMTLLRLHPIYSYDLVAGIPGMEEVAQWVATHHERVDGRGYPDGRSGEDIPIEARILSVADTYVALTSDRPHRSRSTATDASRVLHSVAGTQLDAHLIDVLLGAEAQARSA